MNIKVFDNPQALGSAAGEKAADLIREAIRMKGGANIILATGTSQFETLQQLIDAKDIDYDKVVMFHLDEYIDLPQTHPASFRKYLQERFLQKVAPLKAAHLIHAERSPDAECDRLSDLISKHPIDVALIGIGENGHLAFNDPPADFETERPYIIVELDEACKKQQYGEGWFKTINEVPDRAISMSVKQIMKSQNIICSVAGSRKAVAVKNSLEEPVSNNHPASILQQHPNCFFFMDTESAALLSSKSL